MPCAALNNFLRRDQVAKYTQHEGSLEHEKVSLRTVVPGVWRDIEQVTDLQRVGINSTVEGVHVRNEYVNYLSRRCSALAGHNDSAMQVNNYFDASQKTSVQVYIFMYLHILFAAQSLIPLLATYNMTNKSSEDRNI